MNVRPANLSDVEQIMEIWNPYIKNSLVTFNSSEKTKEDICDLIEVRRKKGNEFWIASKNDKIIGFASYDQLRAGVGYRYSMEHTIIVSAQAKGLGVGKKLMDILCAHAKSRDINSMWAGVSALNIAAIKFHESLEFKTVARLPEVGYKFGTFIDLVLMRKLL
ncbi:MAG: N-acetyltransferase family protein [Rhodobacteraceae bacterium]|nr:N-acetyltransferase family protein [Paracoccaceae bacterium]